MVELYLNLSYVFIIRPIDNLGARGRVVVWGTIFTSRKIVGSVPGEVIGFFNWPNPSYRTMILGSTQPLIEMSTRNIPEVKGSWRMADNFTAIC
jgi:hypothetical protein